MYFHWSQIALKALKKADLGENTEKLSCLELALDNALIYLKTLIQIIINWFLKFSLHDASHSWWCITEWAMNALRVKILASGELNFWPLCESDDHWLIIWRRMIDIYMHEGENDLIPIYRRVAFTNHYMALMSPSIKSTEIADEIE